MNILWLTKTILPCCGVEDVTRPSSTSTRGHEEDSPEDPPFEQLQFGEVESEVRRILRSESFRPGNCSGDDHVDQPAVAIDADPAVVQLEEAAVVWVRLFLGTSCPFLEETETADGRGGGDVVAGGPPRAAGGQCRCATTLSTSAAAGRAEGSGTIILWIREAISDSEDDELGEEQKISEDENELGEE